MPTNPGLRTGTYTTNRGEVYTGNYGQGVYPAGPTPNPKLTTAIDDLLTPGLVPDIARMSAEVSAGRGIAGSPAADSTAVKMSEQNYLQRLGLANTLMTGQTGRDLPYQITPYQQAWLDLQKMLRGVGGGGQGFGGGGGGGAPAPAPSGGGLMPGQHPVIESVYGTRGGVWGNTPVAAGVGGAGTPYAGFGGGGGGGLWGGAGVGGMMGGAGGGDLNLDDIYEELGFGDFGSQPGDVTTPTPPDFDWEMWE